MRKQQTEGLRTATNLSLPQEPRLALAGVLVGLRSRTNKQHMAKTTGREGGNIQGSFREKVNLRPTVRRDVSVSRRRKRQRLPQGAERSPQAASP